MISCHEKNKHFTRLGVFLPAVFPGGRTGLAPRKTYRIEEINRVPGAGSALPLHGRTVSGDYLMKIGIDVFTGRPTHSRVIESPKRIDSTPAGVLLRFAGFPFPVSRQGTAARRRFDF